MDSKFCFLPKKNYIGKTNPCGMSTPTQCVVNLSNPEPANTLQSSVELILRVKPSATTESIKGCVVKRLRENFPRKVREQYEPLPDRERIYYITTTSEEMTQVGLERWTLNFATFALRDHPKVSNVSVAHNEHLSTGEIHYTVTR